MAVECTPNNLATLAACFAGLNPPQMEAVKIYLLAVAAGADPDPQTLAENAKCLMGLSPKQAAAIQSYLLCQIANGSAAACAALSGAGSPQGSVVPQFIGQLYNQGDGTAFFYSTGLTSADWVEIASGSASGLAWGPSPDAADVIDGSTGQITSDLSSWLGIGYSELSFSKPVTVSGAVTFDSENQATILEFAALTTVGGNFSFTGCLNLASLSAPALVSIGGNIVGTGTAVLASLELPELENVAGYIDLSDSAALPDINLPSLETVVGFAANNCPLLASATFPALVSSDSMEMVNCPALVSFSATQWLPTEGSTINFNGCALSGTSVNHILARCVAAGVTTCTIDLAGGTNAAPSGQGIVDATTLTTAGNSVTTN